MSFIRDIQPENSGADEHSCGNCTHYDTVGATGFEDVKNCCNPDYCLDMPDDINQENNCEGYEE